MSFGRVCDEIGWQVIGIVLSAVILWILYRKDEDFKCCQSIQIRADFLLLCNVIILVLPSDINKEPWYIQMCFTGMFVYLMVASVMDCRLQMVSDFLHGIGILSAGILAICKPTEPENGWAVVMFCLIQYLVFRFMYGSADVAGFMVCALFLAAEGRGIDTYLFHMAMTFLVLGIVQLFRGNLSKWGNLKEPVALVPYIMIGFFMII